MYCHRVSQSGLIGQSARLATMYEKRDIVSRTLVSRDISNLKDIKHFLFHYFSVFWVALLDDSGLGQSVTVTRDLILGRRCTQH